jgi:filamentous hemagglutinin family protein
MMRSRTVSLLAAALIALPPGAFANPLGGQVAGGQATIAGQGTSTVTVTQGSQNAIINWNTFNIGAGEKTQFIQPNAGSIALNRVTGGQGVSTIYGTLTANGRVFLINPDGIMIGPGGVVNAAGFLASTNNIKDSDFMAGNYKFTIPGRPDASIVNLGNITAANGGFAALVAPGVRNAGTITANLGSVTLASGNGFTLDFYGDKLITLQVGDKIANQVIDVATGLPLDSLVKNEGKLKANGGQVVLTAAAARHVVDSVINTTGVIEANSVGTKNGMIVLGGATAATKGTGAPTQTVKVSGTIKAKGHKSGEKGGTIQITGEDIQVAGAKINASGQAGGGTVLIGGDTGGGTVNAAVSGVKQAQLQTWSVANASSVSVDAATTINASAKSIGDGGKVVVWSNGLTSVAGSISATGGANGGNGGFVETSGKTVNFAGIQVNTSAPMGTTGLWLLDPTNLTVNADAANTISYNLAKTNVTLQTTEDGASGPGVQTSGPGDIIVNAPISWSSGNTLTLSAYNNISLNDSLTSTGGGAIKLRADNTGRGTGTVTFGGHYEGENEIFVPAQVSTSGHVSIFYNPGSYDGENKSTVSGGNPYSQYMTGGGSLTAYMLVNNVTDLQNVQTNLNGVYALGRDINAGGTATWNDGQGFKPIGQPGNGFTGIFNGTGHAIDGLTIAPTDPNVTNIGLFGANYGTIKNLHLTNAAITANPNSTATTQYVGTLVGQNFGLIKHVSATGTIDGGNLAGVAAGGLVGQNGVKVIQNLGLDHPNNNLGPTAIPGVIKHSSANVAVTIGSGSFCDGPCNAPGWNYAGGLVGINAGVISHSSASGNVTSGSQSFAGGLVGENANFSGATFTPLIKGSFATGDVTSSGVNISLGGLVGANGTLGMNGPSPNNGVIQNSYATGNVSSTTNVSNNDCNSNPGACVFINVGGLVGQNSGLIQGKQTQFQGNDQAFGGGLPEGVVGCGMGLTCASGAVSAGAGGQAGGLVGTNQGIVKYAFATGDVHVGSNGQAGGLVGFNTGTLKWTFAGGNVTGDSGSGLEHDNQPKQTILGGLVGENMGTIKNSIAFGNVGGTKDDHLAQVDRLAAGGLVGDNSGKIKKSFAFGDVTTGNQSAAGGLVAFNSHNNSSCGNCDQGIGQNDKALIKSSFSFGTATAGGESLVGGLAATNEGTIKKSGTGSNVSAGHDSIVGGFVGFVDVDGMVKDSIAIGTVNSTGQNSVAGGFVGLNGGKIVASHAFGGTLDGQVLGANVVGQGFGGTLGGLVLGGVNGTSKSYLGGFVGINVGSITNSSNSGAVSFTGDGNVAGGFVGANVGLIDGSTSTGQVNGSPNNIVGGFAGGNLNFSNVPQDLIQSSSFPVGTITNSTVGPSTGPLPFIGLDATQPGATAAAFTTTNDPAVPPFTGSTSPTGYPGLPSVISGCPSTFCGFLVAGFQPVAPLPPPPDNGGPTFNPQTTINQQITPPTNPTGNTSIQINLTTPDPGSGGPAGGNGGNGGNGGVKPNYGPPPGLGLGRTLDEQMYSGVPPPGETRFRNGELVIQVVDTVPVAQVVATALKAGLVLLSVQHLDQTNRNVFVFRATSATADLRKLIPMLEKINIVASVQPNYNFIAGQTAPAPAPAAPPTVPAAPAMAPASANEVPDLANADTAALQSLPAGDAAQYVIDKFHLGAVHRLASGRNVTIAVIDSEIDVAHPDLRGTVIDRFDATQTASKPHSHGTGMAGAIVSRTRLLGVAPGARIIAIKAFDESATSAEATSFQILRGLDYAVAKNVRIINMSFAGPRDPMMERTLKAAHDKGIILIAAAGNAGPKSPPLYPGADPSVIAVSATDYSDKPFAMANRGKYIAVAAPGVDVMVPAPANGYQLTTGTSVAAAHVSGVAALLLERKPTITPDELRALLMKTSTAFSAKPKGEEDGAGLVDPVGALQALASAKTSDTVPTRSLPATASTR